MRHQPILVFDVDVVSKEDKEVSTKRKGSFDINIWTTPLLLFQILLILCTMKASSVKLMTMALVVLPTESFLTPKRGVRVSRISTTEVSMSSYLDNIPQNPAVGGAGMTSYLDAIQTNTAIAGGAGMTSYLDSMGGFNGVTADTPPPTEETRKRRSTIVIPNILKENEETSSSRGTQVIQGTQSVRGTMAVQKDNAPSSIRGTQTVQGTRVIQQENYQSGIGGAQVVRGTRVIRADASRTESESGTRVINQDTEQQTAFRGTQTVRGTRVLKQEANQYGQPIRGTRVIESADQRMQGTRVIQPESDQTIKGTRVIQPRGTRLVSSADRQLGMRGTQVIKQIITGTRVIQSSSLGTQLVSQQETFRGTKVIQRNGET